MRSLKNSPLLVEEELPLLTPDGIVLFPGMVMRLEVTAALAAELGKENAAIALFTKKGDVPKNAPPEAIAAALHPTGTVAKIVGVVKQSSGAYAALAQGILRARLDAVTAAKPLLKGKVTVLDETGDEGDELEALFLSLRGTAREILERLDLPKEVIAQVEAIDEAGALADLVATYLDAPIEESVELLETLDVKDRVRAVLDRVTRQLEILKMRERINSQIKEEMGKNQREYVLRQQLKAIKEELGEDEDDDEDDLDGLEERIAKANLSAGGRAGRARSSSSACATCRSARPSTRSCAPTSTGSSICRGSAATPDNPSIAAVRKVLDEDHYGLEKVKKRILEYLAVRKLKTRQEGPDPLPHRPARRRQDVARQEHRPRARAQVPSASRSAACTTRRRSAATGARTSARSPARSSRG